MEINPDLLKKYGAGTCTAEERQLVQKWLDEENTGADYGLMPGTEPEMEKTKLITAIDGHLAKKKRRFLFRPAAIAALWLVLTVTCFYIYDITVKTAKESATPEYRTVRVPNGKKISIVLPDGSKAYLNSGTTLTYPETFDGAERSLTLDGDAFFEVVKQDGKPFVVQTQDTRTDVLGTRFNQNSFKENEKTSLTVEQGKVMFTASDNPDTLILVANRRAIHQGGRMQVTETDEADDSSWKDGRLSFNHSTIAEMVPVLERWYDVRITVADPKLSTYKMRGKYENPPLRRVLEDLAYATDIKFSIAGKHVTIYP